MSVDVCVCIVCVWGVGVCVIVQQQAGMSSNSSKHFPGKKAVCPVFSNICRTELNEHMAHCSELFPYNVS